MRPIVALAISGNFLLLGYFCALWDLSTSKAHANIVEYNRAADSWGPLYVSGYANPGSGTDGFSDFNFTAGDGYTYTFTPATGFTLPSQIRQPGCVLAGGCLPPTPVYATFSIFLNPGSDSFSAGLDHAGEDFSASRTIQITDISEPAITNIPESAITNIPEPASWLLTVVGFLCIGWLLKPRTKIGSFQP
jgi:hypothetical protein